MVNFIDEGHIYRHKITNVRYLSTSGLLARYKPEFMGKHWKIIGALKPLVPDYDKVKEEWKDSGGHLLDPKYITHLQQFIISDEQREAFDMYMEALTEAWKFENYKGITRGNRDHNYLEALAYRVGVIYEAGYRYDVFKKEIIPGKNASLVDNLSDLAGGAYPELVVWYTYPEPVYDPILDCMIGGIAGQIDLPLIRRSILAKYVRILDYKTNKEISTHAIYWKNFGYLRWSFPLSDLLDSDLTTYTMQLSTYAYMLYINGFQVEDLTILHKGKRIPVKFEKEYARDMIRHYYYKHSGVNIDLSSVEMVA